MTKNLQKALASAKEVKLLVLDVDGVMTDGRLYIGAEGETIKAFNSHDGHGIKMLRCSGIEVAIISGRKSSALEQRAKELGIKHLYQGREDKITALNELLNIIDVNYQQIAHLGDDLPDLPVIRRVGLGMAVANAYPLVKEHALWCTKAEGGNGAVREACDFIMAAQNTLVPALDQYLH
jgi:3-deoxy-D-manno-octulosonate 8-phosphate phosphatase (KDO 8-P phosphatase)